jgi:hypothetical protein
MAEASHEVSDDRVRLAIRLDGPLIQNMDIKAADLQVPMTTLLAAAVDWYSTELGNPYRVLTMDELPALPYRPEMTNWPSAGTTAHFLLQPEDYERLEQHMALEKLTPEEAGVKVLQCYLFGLQADELDIEQIRSRYDTDDHGFYRPDPPLPDPRDLGY